MRETIPPKNPTTEVNADPPMIVRHVDAGGFARVNAPFSARLGYTCADLEGTALLDWIDPADRAHAQQALEADEGSFRAHHLARDGDSVEFDWEVRRQGGRQVAFGLRHDRARYIDRSVEPRAAKAPETMHETLAAMALIVEAERPGMKCSVLLMDETGTKVSVGGGPSLPREYNEAVEGLHIGPFVGSCGTAAYWKQPVVVTNIQTDPLWKDLREYAAMAGVASCWSHPVTSHSGEVLGAAALYNPVPRAPTQQELNGLATCARMFGLAIERCYADEALQKSEAARATREAELEAQLHQAAKMEALGVLAGGVAHDFNNVLATILANAELGLKITSRESETTELFDDIIAATRNAADLCKQMLAYAGRGAMSCQRVECNGVIREMGGLLSAAMTKKAKLEYDLSSTRLYVEADRAQLVQVIMNLITNAAEALGNEPGTVRARSGIRELDARELERFQPGPELQPGRYVWFSVSDTGCGISPEVRSKMFDPFFTTKFTGRGLGLAAVRGIIHRHRGGVDIETKLGEGTTFTVVFPCADSPVERASAAVPSEAPARDDCVLIVDDDELLRRVLTRGMRAAGFEVLQAGNGRDAIEIFERDASRIDCVLLDLSMPELDGEETFRELEKIKPDLRVVVTSGYAEEEIVSRFDGAGFAGVLRKPTSIDTLVDKIRSTIG